MSSSITTIAAVGADIATRINLGARLRRAGVRFIDGSGDHEVLRKAAAARAEVVLVWDRPGSGSPCADLVRKAGVAVPQARVWAVMPNEDARAVSHALSLGADRCLPAPLYYHRLASELDQLGNKRAHRRRSVGVTPGPVRSDAAPPNVPLSNTVPSNATPLGLPVPSGEVIIWKRRLRSHEVHARRECMLALVGAVEAKDPFTQRHSITVARHADALARRLGLHHGFRAILRQAAMLHDVGKIGIPDSILTKGGALTQAEFEIIKRHPEIAARMLEQLPSFQAELPIVLHHHERFDGTGYPQGLSGTDIPLGARILAVADSIDAMCSRRKYKPRYPLDRVIREIELNSGSQFDPRIADAGIAYLHTLHR